MKKVRHPEKGVSYGLDYPYMWCMTGKQTAVVYRRKDGKILSRYEGREIVRKYNKEAGYRLLWKPSKDQLVLHARLAAGRQCEKLNINWAERRGINTRAEAQSIAIAHDMEP